MKITIINQIPESAVGMIKLFIFFIILLLIFWGLNMGRHIKGGK